MCCTGRCAPSQCETITGPSFSSLNKPDQERTPAYRDSSGSESPSGCLLCYFFRRLGGAIWGIPVQGYRRFADEAVRIGFVRYEDFTVDPDTAMQTLCTRLALSYDPGYRVRQADYSTITGAATATGDIRPAAERAADPLLAVEMAGHAAYGEALELLGYSHPD